MPKRMFLDLQCISLVSCEGRLLGSANNFDGASLGFMATRFCLICFLLSYIKSRLVQASYLASFFEIIAV
jgi:hypothetical protein